MKLRNKKKIELHNYVDYSIGALLIYSTTLFWLFFILFDLKINLIIFPNVIFVRVKID